MKTTRLTIKNIGKIGNMVIDIDKPLLLFYGDIKVGKTTILNAVRYCFGGSFPSDIIKHGEQEAEVILEFEGGSCTRQWYKGKTGTTARSVKLIIDGEDVKKPSKRIETFMNPFLLDQDHLKNKTELERQRYFTELFNVQTDEIDEEIKTIEESAKSLRITIKAYGDIDLTKYESVDVEDLKKNRQKVLDKHDTEITEIDTFNLEVTEHNTKHQTETDTADRLEPEIKELQLKLGRLKDQQYKVREWLKENPVKEKKSKPETPDTSELDTAISNAAANEVRVEQYQANLTKASEKAMDVKKLANFETDTRNKKKKKTAKLAEISESSGIKELSFDEQGNFTYEDTQAGMLSTSQIMKLSSELSALYPEGFGLDLIDRGESLGKSIFEFVKKAEEEDKTILATIVGESPAEVPENIGVFVVENGEVK